MSTTQKTHKITVTAMLAAVATVLMILEFPIPFLIPPFIKMDFSELPALLATFSLGPVSGVAVCFIKNAIHLLQTSTNGVGELCNFLLGCCFVIPAGLLYGKSKSRKGALLGATAGAVVMGIVSIPINLFITYPVYLQVMTPPDRTIQDTLNSIITMYQTLIPSVDGLLTCLVVFNAPFTLLKAALDTVMAFLIYKPLSPLLHK